MSTQSKKLTIKELCLFIMLGVVMLVSKLVMEAFVNIHLLGMFTCLFTVVFRKKALIPIYIYVFLNIIVAFLQAVTLPIWWIPYLYIWTVLWGITMLLPKNMPKRVAAIVYPLVCALHGLMFGTLYAPAQALMYGFDFNQTIAWIIAGLPYDLIHCVGNFFAGMLVLPLSEVLKKAIK